MKHFLSLFAALMLTIAAGAQTMNVVVGDVTYAVPAAQAGEMVYNDGTTLTILNKQFAVSDITKIYIDNTTVEDNTVQVAYNGTSAQVTVAGNVAQYVTPTVSGAHVSIEQTNTDAVDGDEITYSLSGTTTDGELALSGSYKCTVQLAGLTLTNPSGAAINITNKKRIQISAKQGTVNTLTDCTNGSQSGCIYSKGQIQLQGKGTLTVYGKTKHAIKSGDYITVKNLTLNVLSAVNDGINCNGYFQMTSGTVSISGVGDDGIQADLDGTTSTGETTDHEDEDSGNIYLEGGSLTVSVTAAATKGIKAAGDLKISDGTITVNTSGAGAYDSDEKDAKGCAGLKSDGNMTISGGTITLKSTGTGGKCIKADGKLTISNGTVNATTTGSQYRYSSQYTASPKAIKSDGAMTVSGGTVVASSSYHEAIESKSTLDVTGGYVYAQSSDDAINSASHMTISGGYVMGNSSGNDGLDANGNMYIKGGNVVAVSTRSPEVALDANTEGNYKLYVQGGNILAVGGLESGSTISNGTAYQVSSYTKGSVYGLYKDGTLAFAVKLPSNSSMGTPLVVYTTGTATLKSGMTGSGTTFWNGYGYDSASGGSSVTLSSYSGGSGGGGFGPGGGGPGGGGKRW
jgi:hypothetical protein